MNTKTAWLLPLLLYLLIAPFTPWLDINIEESFYRGNGEFSCNSFFTLMYDHGSLPALTLFILATTVLPVGFLLSPLEYLRKPALLLFFTMAIGAGLLAHVIFKDNWGRPRPKQVIEFGGTQEYRPFWSPNFTRQPEPSKSFPSGHSTMGFYFFAPALAALQARRKGLAAFFFSIAFGLGIVLSISRMACGGHFFSDTLTSALLMWLTALFLTRIIYGKTT